MKEFIDKLIERLKKLPHAEEDMWIWLIDAEVTIRELAEEYKVSEMPTGWISVSERLPSERGKYLVTAKNITGWWILENNVFVCDYAYDTFIFQGWEDNEVIAWCELPAPFKEGE